MFPLIPPRSLSPHVVSRTDWDTGERHKWGKRELSVSPVCCCGWWEAAVRPLCPSDNRGKDRCCFSAESQSINTVKKSSQRSKVIFVPSCVSDSFLWWCFTYDSLYRVVFICCIFCCMLFSLFKSFLYVLSFSFLDNTDLSCCWDVLHR